MAQPMGGRKYNSFSPIELSIHVAIFGLLACVILPSYHNHQHQKDLALLATSFRTYAGALEEYLATGPDQTGLPVDLEEVYNEFPKLSKASSLGGYWDLDCGKSGKSLRLSLVNASLPGDLPSRLDRMLDDGDLATGRFYGDASRLTMIIAR